MTYRRDVVIVSGHWYWGLWRVAEYR
jgi:hypothetical protein